MLEHQHRFRLQRMAAVFGVSRSGYYQWRRNGEEPGEKALRRAALDEKINKVFTQGKQRDGARRIQVALAENGDHADLKTILNSMKRQGLKAKAARKFKVTTDSNHQLPVAPNLLEQNFSADAPNQKWVGDITYLLTNEGWLYLAVIIDLYSRAVIGWSMSSRMVMPAGASLTPGCLTRPLTLKERRPLRPLAPKPENQLAPFSTMSRTQ